MAEVVNPPVEGEEVENEEEQEEVVEAPPLKELNPESAYDDVTEARRAEEIANKFKHGIHPKAMPTRAYINSAVAEMVYKGLYELNRARPADPVEFFAYYLLKHNPKQ
jgi:protein dpy-30